LTRSRAQSGNTRLLTSPAATRMLPSIGGRAQLLRVTELLGPQELLSQ
jgi:hypothetical protein